VALKILFADDSMTAQNMGKKILVEAGYDVVAVSNGRAAWKKIEEQNLDLFILDVYMPGYSGVELCEKVRNKAETANKPVLLTVGKMEPFKAEEGSRVKADGVVIKPFEASDLLAAVKKLEQRLMAPAAPPEAERTLKLERPLVEEFKDASYQEWKVEAEDRIEEETAGRPRMEVPQEMKAAPAFSDFLGEPARPAPAVEEQPRSFGAPVEETAPVYEANPPVETESEAAAREAVAQEPGPPARTSFVRDAVESEETEGPIRQDPSLVTDTAGLAGFATKFGVDNPEPVPVGIAADMPQLYRDSASAPPTAEASTAAPAEHDFEARVAAAMSSYEADEKPQPEEPPTAEAAAAAPAEDHTALVQEMQKAFADLPVETAPLPEEAVAPPPAAAVSEAAPASGEIGVPDRELAAAMAAAVGAETTLAPPAKTPAAVDSDVLAQIVQRVVERMKPDLIAEITKEIKKQK